MKSILSTVAILIFSAVALSGQALAACDNSSLQGKYAGYYVFQESESYWGSQGGMMVRFNGRGGLQVIKAVEAGEGFRDSAGGSGSYKVQANCTGTATANVKVDGVVIGKAKLDIFIAGTRAAPKLHGIIVNQFDAAAGRFQLEKSNL